MVVEHDKFQSFLTSLNPHYGTPCRQTISQRVHKLYACHKASLIEHLNSVSSCASITCDAWTSAALDPYLIITLHWIDETWKAHNIVLDFCHFPYPHTAKAY